ncbi:MAG: phospho-sugar mutase, partial [Clostridiales bacterium]|nr:phospho-sugar mutase [Clostridiales bacterium]
MDIMNSYNDWCKNATEDNDLITELESIKNNEDEIHERFYTSLKFGTAGLRGIIGAGTNRMNIYVVRQATQGLANYVLQKYGKGSVAISHDSRIKADLFMIEAARVLAANGIKAYITKELEPTPVLSYLVRYFKCQAGIMITASHNPAAYNGYKAYGEDGCQMTDVAANAVYDEICRLDMFNDVKTMDFDKALG